MLDGDELVEKIKDRSVFLVGESRVGKSTLFNYLTGLPLKVEKDSRNRYIYVTDNGSMAVAKSGYTSATLLPNINPKLILNGIEVDVSLQDMAGYKDAGRNYVGVFGVSYMLKVALARARKSRFILVVEDAKMQISQIRDVAVVFQNFIQMLKIQYLIDQPQVADKLFSSVSLVVSKATEDAEFYLGTI